MTSIYNKDLKNDSVKMQIIQEYYGNNKSSYEISRELGIPARTIQNFLAKDTHKGWHLENEEVIDKYFNGFGYDAPKEDTPDKIKHLENIGKAKKFYDCTRSALVGGNKMIRIPSQYLEEDVSESDAEVLDAFLKCMQNLEKCQENGILFVGMSQQEITNLIESIRSGVQVFTDKEGNVFCIDEIYEDRLTFKLDEDVKAFKDVQDLMKEVHAGKHSEFILPIGCGKKEVVDNSRILLISDLHVPYHHKDSVKFLQHLKDKYTPTRIICLGDEVDHLALSYHEKETEAPSAFDELKMALPVIKQIEQMFPVMDILDSNHGSLAYRKAKTAGIPKHYLKSYADVLQVGNGWKWHFDMVIDLPTGQKCYLHHGKSSNITKTSQAMSMCSVAGHYHNTFKIEYWANPIGLYWGMQAGCLIDDKSFAFNYNNVNLHRPLIGTGLIINGLPILEPMVLDSQGNWIEK